MAEMDPTTGDSPLKTCAPAGWCGPWAGSTCSSVLAYILLLSGRKGKNSFLPYHFFGGSDYFLSRYI